MIEMEEKSWCEPLLQQIFTCVWTTDMSGLNLMLTNMQQYKQYDIAKINVREYIFWNTVVCFQRNNGNTTHRKSKNSQNYC